MVSDFLGAAFPWILIGLFVAISCSLMSKKRNKSMFVVRWKKCCYALGDFKRLFYKGFNSKNYDGGILYQYHQNRGYVA